jgi:RNA polymerase sigma factor (sigma-70 family)
MPYSIEKLPTERLAAAKSAEQEIFLSLVDTHQRLLLKVCWTYTRTSHDRDDLLQEIVGRLWSAFRHYDRDRSFSTWMYRVALNVAIDFRRRRQRQDLVTLCLDDVHDPQSPRDEPKQSCCYAWKVTLTVK